jgi:hypothetical protein
MHSTQVYEIRPRKDKRGVDLISDALPFGRLWYDTKDDAMGYAMHSSRSHDAVIRVLRVSGQRDQIGRAQGRFQGAVSDPLWDFEPNKKPPRYRRR